jgi:predicted N-acyltransferase
MRLTPAIIERIAGIPEADWNALDGSGNPFVSHAFLDELEANDCVGGDSGWVPQHLVLRDEQDRLVAAAPQYLKQHSWGEFIFDWSWAQAYARAGLDYYPKLLSAVPYTPVTGPRLLVAGPAAPALRAALAEQIRELAQGNDLSGAHVNFTTPDDQAALEAAGFLRREDCRFMWRNRDFGDFEQFLARFRADKRKKLRRERRRIAEAGIEFRTLAGEAIDRGLWATIFGFSERTFLLHGNAHYLNAAFLMRVARRLPGVVVVKLALQAGRPIAAAIFFRGAECLYGRYWGAARHEDSLHFELCYYQGIEYCIEQRLASFDPGTQGEHKLARGFEPTTTSSAHWLADRRFATAIASHLARERAAITAYVDAAREHLPFHRDDA